MSDKMNVWNALKTTDPKYTKKVEFGRKFTSINSQWQLQRMTEHFGPIGQGWGYNVDHAVERISDDYVLAVADVTIWWRADDKVAQYGPVRGMSPIVEKGKNGLHFDDDAGKKAMTDALTKGLSHLGLSADVFLGLFDDNKYVQKVSAQFKGATNDPTFVNTNAAPAHPFSNPKDFADEARRDGLTTETRSTYEITKERKAIELLSKTALLAIGISTNRIQLKTWWDEHRADLRDKLPEDDFAAVRSAVEAKRDDLPAVAA